MRKITSVLLIGFLLLFLSACQNNQNSKYPMGGRDTHKVFGDGRFAILIGERYPFDSPEYNPNTNRIYTLFDRENQHAVEISVYEYREIEPCVYIIGENGYTFVNYATGYIEQHKSLDDFSPDIAKIFMDGSTFIKIP